MSKRDPRQQNKYPIFPDYPHLILFFDFSHRSREVHYQKVVPTFNLACSDAFRAFRSALGGIDALRHEAQPNNRLGGEVQCDARPDHENDHPDDAVL